MNTTRRRPWFALALAGAGSLSACAGEGQATFEASADPSVQAEADDGPGQATAEGAESAEEGSTQGTTEEGTTAEVEPAAARTIEVDESESNSDERDAYTLTVHRVVVNDYYIEAEITLVNDGDQRLKTWYGSSNTSLRLFDDQGREYPFQVQAGGDSGSLILESGEGVDAVLVFAGRLHPEVEQLTLDFESIGARWPQFVVAVPPGSAA